MSRENVSQDIVGVKQNLDMLLKHLSRLHCAPMVDLQFLSHFNNTITNEERSEITRDVYRSLMNCITAAHEIRDELLKLEVYNLAPKDDREQ
jgi:hypothetical protein